MPRLQPARLTLALFWILVGTSGAAEPSALEQARALLARGEGEGAAAVLESALPSANAPERVPLLAALRKAYELAAREAEAAGKTRQAEAYRENLLILNRKSPPKPPEARAPSDLLAPPFDPARAETAAQPAAPTPQPLPVPEAGEPQSAAPPERSEPRPSPELGAALATSAATSPAARLAAADSAFRARNYGEAGALYALLAREQQLPESRREHWAYCRCAEVVRRINANPHSAEEWQAIQTEVEQIPPLSPRNWYGEYLRNLVKERSAGALKSGATRKSEEKSAGDSATRSSPIVIRGAAPEEPTEPMLPIRPRGPRDPQAGSDPPSSEPAARTAPEPPIGRAGQPFGNWQTYLTTNFRILHADAALAERVARTAEAARAEQTRHWTGQSPRSPWSPRCDIYLYPNGTLLQRMTGQPAESPGFSTMGLHEGRIVARRLNLRADHPNLITAVVPHEVTHVVLADLFPNQQIPRWADEGMAVLSEPQSEQHQRAADLNEPLAAGRLFRVQDLMAMDYPDGRYWPLYYAQSVSLTRYLVERNTPAKFIQFLQSAQQIGPEAALQRVYQFQNFSDLDQRWLAHAKSSTDAVAEAANPAAEPNATRR